MAIGRKPSATWQSILVSENYLSEADVRRIEAEAAATHVNPLDAAFALGVITKPVFGQAIAEYYGMPFADMQAHPPARELVTRVPESVARDERRILFRDEGGEVVIATDRPYWKIESEFAAHFPGKKVTLAYTLPEYVDLCLVFYRKALDTRFAKIVAEGRKVAPEMFDEILSDAVAFRASDVHFEPREEDALIRFRIDGLLENAGRLSKELYENVLNRIKVLARLRTDDHFSTQDGAIRAVIGGQGVDVRVSVVPLLDGEKVVLRLLSESMRSFQLADLGLMPTHRDLVVAAATKPFGLVLAVGPTGSGKTTTLYAAAKFLNRPDVNISTIEDPVEYKIPGINHMQVNPQTDLTFARGLRSIIRQDPDVILVGEIRDRETADIAVNAALTGHLVLSTFHANDAASAVPRLIDMGVEPFLLSSTVELIVAQRLARRICASCRVSVVLPRAELAARYPWAARTFSQKSVTVYRGKGCSACLGSGCRGRIAVVEMIRGTQALRELVMRRPSAEEVRGVAAADGMRPMFADGLEKVVAGLISLEELARVVSPPEA